MREDENGEIVLVTDPDEDDSARLEVEEQFDIAELVADNQVLLNRVDLLLGGDEDGLSTRRSLDFDDHEEVESLTSSLIDGLYKQVKGEANAGKKPKQKAKPFFPNHSKR